MTGPSAPLLMATTASPRSGGLAEEVRHAVSLLSDTLAVIRSQAPPSFWVALLVGVVLATAGWLGAAYFARLWNRRYRLPTWQHALCAAAALLTLAAVPVWAAATYIKDTAEAVSELWEERLAVDETWHQKTYAEAFDTVKRLGTEDFAGVPRPGQPSSRIPLTDSASVRVVAEVYARRAAAHFREQYPHLSAFIRETNAGRVADLDTWSHLEASGALLPLQQRARQAAATAVAHVLDPVLLWVRRVRLTIGSLVFAAHLLTFGVAGTLAARDIHVYA